MKTQQSQPIQSEKVKNSSNTDMERLACLWIEIVLDQIMREPVKNDFNRCLLVKKVGKSK